MISHLHHVVITQREGQLHTGQVTDGKKTDLVGRTNRGGTCDLGHYWGTRTGIVELGFFKLCWLI